MIAIDGFYYHFCRYVYLVGGDVFRFCELLDGEYILFLGCACGVIAELVEVYEGFGYREDKGGGGLEWWGMCRPWEDRMRVLQFGGFPLGGLCGHLIPWVLR